MRKMVEKLLAAYGTEMTITGPAGKRSVRGFFRAVNSKSWQSMEHKATVLGEVPQRQYAYIGPGDVDVAEGDTVTLAGKSYLLRRVEPYFYGKDIVYRWGMCVEKGEVDPWGIRSWSS